LPLGSCNLSKKTTLILRRGSVSTPSDRPKFTSGRKKEFSFLTEGGGKVRCSSLGMPPVTDPEGGKHSSLVREEGGGRENSLQSSTIILKTLSGKEKSFFAQKEKRKRNLLPQRKKKGDFSLAGEHLVHPAPKKKKRGSIKHEKGKERGRVSGMVAGGGGGGRPTLF